MARLYEFQSGGTKWAGVKEGESSVGKVEKWIGFTHRRSERDRRGSLVVIAARIEVAPRDRAGTRRSASVGLGLDAGRSRYLRYLRPRRPRRRPPRSSCHTCTVHRPRACGHCAARSQ